MAPPLFASVTLKISASNPSLFTERKVSLKSFLPRGIRPENVIDANGLEIGYDVKQGQCYVYKDLVLEPKSDVSFDVEIDDIWVISDEILTQLGEETADVVSRLAKTEFAEVSMGIQKKIEADIVEIRALQDDALVYKVGPTEHITVYESNKETVAAIDESIDDLERLVLSTKESVEGAGREGLLKFKTTVQRFRSEMAQERLLSVNQSGDGSCLVEMSLQDEPARINFESPQTVSFKVGVENSSLTESRIVPVRYFLAKEVKGKDVLDPGELKVGFDFEKSLYYVFNDHIELAPAEERVFDVVLRNQWVIDKRKVYASKVYIESMIRAARQVSGLGTVERMGGTALDTIYELLARQGIVELTERSVVAFREDEKLLENVNRDIQKMADLMAQAGVSPEMTLMEQEDSCKEAKELGMSKEDMEKGLNTASVLESEKVKLLAGTIFKGKSISAVSTWKIIGFIILFLGIISSVFYFVNIRQQKRIMFDPLTGAFSRSYALERFREELKIAKGAGKKCSLLVMDIDKFKGINDTYGHSVGDTILKEFVIAMRKGVRATDIVGRFGGDEFMIILPTSEKDKAHKIAQGIARIVEGSIIKISQKMSLHLTTSIGVATYPDDSATAEDIFDKADQALYQVKKRGGNGAEAFAGGE